MSGKTRTDCSLSLASCMLPGFQQTATRAVMQPGQGLAIPRSSYGLRRGVQSKYLPASFSHLIDVCRQAICVGTRKC
ncbi:hypothetical protein LY78DRAFT_36070 [Colletotrichum sublineola]|nr:hypothetical protein LY78DRAFT_36070 [Colletotrichum sublineola]